MEIISLLNTGVSVGKQDNRWLLEIVRSSKNDNSSCDRPEIEDKKFDDFLLSCNIDPNKFRYW